MNNVFLLWSGGTLIGGWALIYAGLTTYSLFVESVWFRKLFIHGTGGSARWGGPLAFLKHNFLFCRKAPIYFGRTLHKYDPWPFCQAIGVDDENHMVTIAMSRSGKSTTVIWPNLVKYPYPYSVFVLDPKGEHAIMTGAARAKQGQAVYVLDPFGVTKGKVKTHFFNPLAEIDPNSGRVKEDIGEIADACVIRSASEDATAKHFNDLQRTIISGLIGHVLSTEPKEKHNLPAIYDLFIEMGRGEGGFEKLIEAMKHNTACGNTPQEAALAYANAGRNERGSIFTSTLTSLKWIASSDMREHLKRSDFSLSELKRRSVSLYVVLDFDAMAPEKQGRYMRIVINLALQITHVTDMPPQYRSKGRRVLFVLDEVAQLSYMPSIERAFKTHAGSLIKLWCFFQNYGSLKDNYASHHDMLENSSKQFFGCGGPQTAAAIEGYLGKYLDVRPTGMGAGDGVYESQKSLLDASEIMDTLKKSEAAQIVVTANNEKMELKRIACIPLSQSGFSHPSSSPEPAWCKGLSEKDLDDYVICIPYMDCVLDKVLWQQWPSIKNSPIIKKDTGDWVKKGDVIALNPDVIAPVDGQIVITTSYDEMCIWEKDEDWPKNRCYGSDDEWLRTTKVKIRPLKGTEIHPNLVREAYQWVIDSIEESLPPKRGTSLMRYKNKTPPKEWTSYMNTVSEALEIIKTAKPKIELTEEAKQAGQARQAAADVRKAEREQKAREEAEKRMFYDNLSLEPRPEQPEPEEVAEPEAPEAKDQTIRDQIIPQVIEALNRWELPNPPSCQQIDDKYMSYVNKDIPARMLDKINEDYELLKETFCSKAP